MTWLVNGPKFPCTHCSGNLFSAMPLTPPLSPVSKQYQPSPEGQSLNINERRWIYDFSGDWMITEHLRTKRTASLQPCSKQGSSTVGSACSGHCPQILKPPRTEIHRLSGQPAPTLNYLYSDSPFPSPWYPVSLSPVMPMLSHSTLHTIMKSLALPFWYLSLWQWKARFPPKPPILDWGTFPSRLSSQAT